MGLFLRFEVYFSDTDLCDYLHVEIHMTGNAAPASEPDVVSLVSHGVDKSVGEVLALGLRLLTVVTLRYSGSTYVHIAMVRASSLQPAQVPLKASPTILRRWIQYFLHLE